MKKILVIHYSQSGQLTEIVNNICAPINCSDVSVVYHKLEMEKDFPFPWNKLDFFGVFPESFLQIPQKIKPIPEEILKENYDLVILGCQVWYLSPSIPVNSFLKSSDAKQLLAGVPVVTVIGCRNMWIMAQEKVKKLIKECDAKLVGNIALVDRHINHISVITIVQWMFTGVKKKYLGVFPKPGVSEKDINESSKFGKVILECVLANDYGVLQGRLLEKGAVEIKSFLVLIDKRANVFFGKWARLIHSKGGIGSPKRDVWLKIFNYYLLFAIWMIAPIVFILFLLAYIPFLRRINRDKKYYSSIELK